VEAEAYKAYLDRSSHSFEGKRTIKNQHLYAPGSIRYVYICYGIHNLVNVVTNQKEIPEEELVTSTLISA
jgi:DNA-3-methyladenine glycosylase